jgi:polar amino acid transport system permease protein
MRFDATVVTQNADLFLWGLLVTLEYTVITCVLGILIGLIAALLQLIPVRPAVWLGRAWVECFRSLPLLVLLFWFYYALPIFLEIKVSREFAGIVALSCYGSGFYGEILRAGVQSIDVGQSDAAMALGMSYVQRMRRILLPQALRRMIPPLAGQTIIQLKNTTLLSVVTIPDLLYQASYVSSFTYRPMEVYSTIGVMFLVILLPLTLLSRRFETLRVEA